MLEHTDHHTHEHEPDTHHVHKHIHERVIRQNNLAALGVGTLHGFAGISHLVLMLPTLALPSMKDSVLYLAGFAAGTIGAMITYAVIVGFISHKSENAPSTKIFTGVRLTGGLIAIAIGIYWILASI